MKITFFNPDELDKNLKVTIHKTGKMGFTMDAAKKLSLIDMKSANIGVNNEDPEDDIPIPRPSGHRLSIGPGHPGQPPCPPSSELGTLPGEPHIGLVDDPELEAGIDSLARLQLRQGIYKPAHLSENGHRGRISPVWPGGQLARSPRTRPRSSN